MHFLTVAFLILAPVLSWCYKAEVENNEIEVDVFTTESELLKKYPNAKKLELSKEEAFSERVSITYSLGGRVPGDRLVASGSDSYSWPDPRDVKLELSYPNGGVGAVVSYLAVGVIQDTNIGSAYVVSGGIGQRRITIAVHAGHTKFLGYNVQIFGR